MRRCALALLALVLAGQASAQEQAVCEEGELTQEAYVKAPNPREGDQFGYSVAVFEDTLVVGAFREDHTAGSDTGDLPDAGATYVFVRQDGVWTQQARLTAENAEAYDGFGYAVALHGDTLAVGAIYEGSGAPGASGEHDPKGSPFSGAVYVFARAGGQWSQQAFIKAFNPGLEDHFGGRLALFEDTLVVGVPQEDSSATGVSAGPDDDAALDSGAVYVFVREDGAWSQQAYLKSANSKARDRFGFSVAIFEDTLAVGAPNESGSLVTEKWLLASEGVPSSGAVYVFGREGGDGSAWSQQAYLKAPEPGKDDGFGLSVALYAGTLAVGASYEDGVLRDSGAVYVFEGGGSDWQHTAYLKAPNVFEAEYFGSELALHEDRLAVGVPFDAGRAADGSGGVEASGAAYVFERCAGEWTAQAYVKAADPGRFAHFGRSVAIHAGTLAVGAYWEDGGAPQSGAAYVFRLTP